VRTTKALHAYIPVLTAVKSSHPLIFYQLDKVFYDAKIGNNCWMWMWRGVKKEESKVS